MRNLRTAPRLNAVGSVILILLALLLGAWVQAQPDGIGDKIHDLVERGGGANFDLRELDIAGLRSFYSRRHDQPAWTGSGPADRDAAVALQYLEHANDEGLDRDRYHLREIALRARPAAAQSAAEYDVLLSDAVLRYASDVHGGRSDLRLLDRDVGLPDKAIDLAGALDAALASDRVAQFLAGLAPPHAQYKRLKSALARYRDIAAKGGWSELPSVDSKKPLSNADAALLRNRLAYEDAALTLQPDSDPLPALIRFQEHHGLDPDGRIGPKTLLALNTPASERVDEIVANMERWRWVPESFGPRYVLVNAADATLQVIDNGKVVLESRVIAGKPSTPTAIFAASIIAITVNPPWNIPEPIVRHEILPKARRHPGYLASNHIVEDSSGGFQQLPGPDNALGELKLEMPNRFDIYLHDTPARSLFASSERHRSHGCIRVEQIRPLASFALRGDLAAGLGEIADAIGTGETQRIPLDNSLPVFVLYWTAIANEDGLVDFRSDVYGRDQRLLAALAGQHPVGRLTMNTITECHKA